MKVRRKFCVLLCCFLLVALNSGCSNNIVPNQEASKNEEETKTVDYGISVMAEDVIKGYSDNELSADKQYLDRKLCVAGTVVNIGKDYDNKPYITIGIQRSLNLEGIRCYIRDSELDKAMDILKGDQIIVSGMCRGLMTFDVKMEDCTLINLRILQDEGEISLSGKDQYVVGLDIPSGRYSYMCDGEVLIATGEEPFWSENMDVGSIYGITSTTLDLYNGDVIHSENDINFGSAIQLINSDHLLNGMWLVGFDIKPGKYQIKVDEYDFDGDIVISNIDGDMVYNKHVDLSKGEFNDSLVLENGSLIIIKGIDLVWFYPE